jgi:hypothetical protein
LLHSRFLARVVLGRTRAAANISDFALHRVLRSARKRKRFLFRKRSRSFVYAHREARAARVGARSIAL